VKLFKFLIIIAFCLFRQCPLPGDADAYLIWAMSSILWSAPPAGLMEIIRRHRKDFLYGTLMADIIIGKKYMPKDKSSHSWEVAFDLMKSARTDQQRAFVHGYMSHLAADTVAHNTIRRTKNLGHTLME